MQVREELTRNFPALCGSLSRAEVDQLLAALERRELAAQEVLLTAGEPSACGYLLLSGNLEVVIDPTGARVVVPPGNFIGEVSLLDGGPATATVLAGSPAVVLCLKRDALDGLRKSAPRVAGSLVRAMTIAVVARLRRATDNLEGLRLGSTTSPPPAARRPSLIDALRALVAEAPEMSVLETLRKNVYTADLPEADLRALNSAMAVTSHPDGHVFIKEGSRGDTLFLLLEGEVSVRRERSTLSADLKAMQPGEFFGQLALIDNERRAATCTAVGPVRVASLPQSAFSFLFSAHAPIAEALQRAVAVQVMRDFRNVMQQIREALARVPSEHG